MHEAVPGDLETIGLVLIRLSYADRMSEWESIRVECESEHLLQGEYKIRPCFLNGASVDVDLAGRLFL